MACSRWRRSGTALAAALLWLLLAALAWPAAAGVMTKEALARRFPAPLMVGEKDAALPI